MGYYSDVKLITTKEGWKRIQREVKQAAPDGWTYTAGDEAATPIMDGKYVLVEHEDIKWYETQFPEVDAFARELKRFDVEHIPYEFMRVGEDWTDTEYYYERDGNNGKYNDMPHLSLSREIEVEYQ